MNKKFLFFGGCVCVMLVLLLGSAVLQFTHLFPVQAKDEQVSVALSDTLSPLLANSHVVGLLDPQKRISLALGLRPRNASALTSYARDITHAGSSNYHRFLTPAQYDGIFSPDVSIYNKVQSYLQAQGFIITKTYNHRLLLAFSGTVAQVVQTFHVRLKNYTALNGRSYFANDSAPLLPAWLAGQVQSIAGLNNAVQWHRPPYSHTLLQQSASTAAVSCPVRGNGYLTPNQVATAYNLNSLYNNSYQGGGQTIALFELSTFVMSDLSTYSSCFGNSHAIIQTVTTGSAPAINDADMTEVELDAQLVLSTAPQLGRLRIYETAKNTADYLAEWAQIVQDAVPVVSTSWGACEDLMGADLLNQENILFTSAAIQGQSIFAASGDSGSAGCTSSNSAISGLNAEDPAAQPYVTGVGGTTLSLSANSNYGSEQVWNNQPDPVSGYTGGASGGGISHFWTAPTWQSAPGVNNSYSSSTACSAATPAICRETPDVSLNADPNNGYLVYCSAISAGCNSKGDWYIFGGTSAAAPLWAAMMALTNQMSLAQGGFNLGFVNPLLYQIANDPTLYSASFHDITTGTNDYNHLNSNTYPAMQNYDLATGLGSYNAFALATHLVALAGQKQRVSPAASTWYFAEGSVGGGFQEYLTLQNPSSNQDAQVAISYLFQTHPSITITHIVNRSSRATFSANNDLGIRVGDRQQAIAAIIQVLNGGPGVVAERPMYFTYRGIQSGSDVMGATTPGISFYFPNVDTRQNGRAYYSYITMLNPSSTQNANVTITYYTGHCGQGGENSCPAQQITIGPRHRGTVTPLSFYLYQQTAVSVQSAQAIVVERPMYFQDTINTAGGFLKGATSTVGATTPVTDWLFAEGYTGTNFQEYLVLANFATTSTAATITLEYSNGHTQTITVSVPALGQLFFDVNQANIRANGTCDISPCQITAPTSAEVVAGAPIVAERLLYFHYGSQRYTGATETIGEPGPATHSVYSFAEGYTAHTIANSFDEYVTIQNPTTSDETIAVTFFADSYVFEQNILVKAHSRYTLSVNSFVAPIAQNYNNLGSNSYAVSLSLQAIDSGAKIVAERPMYFNYHGDQGGTDVLGFSQ